MRIPLLTSIPLLPLFAGCSSEDAQANSNPLLPPLGHEEAKLVPAPENELTAEKAQLGKQLFFDKRLSGSGSMGCVDCHYPDQAFTDGIAFSTKDGGGKNSRNAPTMFNVGYYPELYWDGRKTGLESNILAAWTGQLAGKPDEVAGRLNGVAAYKTQFQQAFGGEANEQRIVQALASFLRTLRSGNSAYDKFVDGDKGAMSDAAQKGYALFSSKGCQLCHTPGLFTDLKYHNVGIGMKAEQPDVGRLAVEKDNAAMTGAFKTPTLRDVARTAPYGHDGSVATLREMVKLMGAGGIDNPHKDPLLQNQSLSDAEIDQLVAFLESLNGDVPWKAPDVPK
jgi:cytochrome c peroxidase